MLRRKHLSVAVLLAIFTIACGQHVTGPREGFVDVPGGRAWYRIVGSGPGTPLLLVHGGPGAGSCYFSGLAQQLSDERPVVLYDQLGSGRSDRPSDRSLWRIERFVDELAAIRRTLRLDRVHLLGHSWGAALVAEYLLNSHASGIESVIFAGPLLSTPRWIADANVLLAELPETVQQIVAQHERQGTTSSPEYQKASQVFYSRFLYHHQPAPKFPDCPFNQAVYEQMWGPSEFHATGNLKEFDRVNRLSEIHGPVLFIVGRFDEARVVTVSEFQHMIPGSKLAVVEDAGHMAMVDEPESYTQAIRSFLRQAQPQ
jgi:proline iminopeptidase